MWAGIDFSSGTPLLQQMLPSVPDGVVTVLNRVSLLAAVFVAAAGWEHLGVRRRLEWLFGVLSKLKSFVFLYTTRTNTVYLTPDIPTFTKVVYQADGQGLVYDGKTGDLVGEERIITAHLMPELGYLFLAITALVLLFWSQHSFLHWLVYPFLQLGNAIFEWRHLSFHPWWLLLIVPLKSIGYVLWALVSYVLIFMLGLGGILRTFGNASDWIGQRMTQRAYNCFLGFSTCIVAITALLTAK